MPWEVGIDEGAIKGKREDHDGELAESLKNALLCRRREGEVEGGGGGFKLTWPRGRKSRPTMLQRVRKEVRVSRELYELERWTRDSRLKDGRLSRRLGSNLRRGREMRRTTKDELVLNEISSSYSSEWVMKRTTTI